MSILTTAEPRHLSVVTEHSVEEHEQINANIALICNRYKDRLTTLPKEKGWVTDTLYLHEGFWHERKNIISVFTVMAAQETFKAHPSDIYFTTLPKCGTTWLKALAFAIVNRNQYKNKPFSTHPLQVLNPHICLPYIEYEILNPRPTYDLTQTSPRLFATHMSYNSLPRSVIDSGCRIVYMCRNPKDVLVSMFHFANKLRDKSLSQITFEEAFDMFSKGVSPNGPYWDHVKGYYKASKENPAKILFLTYEDMKMHTVNTLKQLAEFLGYPFTEEEEAKGVVQEIIQLCSFENLKEANKDGFLIGSTVRNDAFFREGKVGDWINHLTDEMSQILDQITEQEFHGLDISF